MWTELYHYDKKLLEAFLMFHKHGTTLRMFMVDINIRAWQLNVVFMLKYWITAWECSSDTVWMHQIKAVPLLKINGQK